MASPVEFILKITDRVTAPIRRITNNFAAMEKGLSALRKSTEFAANLNRVADGFDKVGAGARSALEGPIRAAASLEERLDVVAAKSGASAEQLERVKAKARELGSDPRFKFSASDAAGGFEQLSAAGVDVEDQLTAIDPVLVLAAAGFTDVSTAAKLNTDVIGAWGKDISFAATATDQLIGAANKTKQSIETLSQSLKDAGPTAAAAGAELSDVLAIQGVLAAGGVTGSQAGVATANLYKRLQVTSAQGRRELRRMRVKTTDESGNMRALDEIMADLSRGLDKRYGTDTDGKRREQALSRIFGDDVSTSSAAKLMMRASALPGTDDKSFQAIKSTIEAYDASGAAAAASANTMGAIATAKSAWEELQITVGDHLLPVLTDVLGEVTDLFRTFGSWAAENPELVRQLALVAAGVAAIGTVGGPLIRGVAMIVQVFGLLGPVLGGISTVLPIVAAGFKGLAVALVSNPIVALGVAIAGVAYLIWDNWDDLPAFFEGVFDSVVETFDAAVEAITGKAGVVRDAVAEILDLQGETVAVSSAVERAAAVTSSIAANDNAYSAATAAGAAAVPGLPVAPAVANLDTVRAISASVAGGQGGGVGGLAEGAAGALSSFAGELKIRVEGAGGESLQVVGAESTTRGDAPIKLNTGVQGAA